MLVVSGAGAAPSGRERRQRPVRSRTPWEQRNRAEYDRDYIDPPPGRSPRYPPDAIASAGALVAMICDIRVITEQSSFGAPEIRRGWHAGSGNQDLPRLIGFGNSALGADRGYFPGSSAPSASCSLVSVEESAARQRHRRPPGANRPAPPCNRQEHHRQTRDPILGAYPGRTIYAHGRAEVSEEHVLRNEPRVRPGDLVGRRRASTLDRGPAPAGLGCRLPRPAPTSMRRWRAALIPRRTAEARATVRRRDLDVGPGVRRFAVSASRG